MIEVDGSLGEGGGQILRTALFLATATRQKLRIVNIRSGRKRPGLRPQHLQCVTAAAEICGGQVEGAKLDSQELIFYPGEIRPGIYRFDIGTAGSAALVVQTIFLPLSTALGSSKVTVIGGTHVPWSPCFQYLDWHWLHFMRKIGFQADLSMKQAGFYPQGGGQIQAEIKTAQTLQPLRLQERGRLLQVRGISGVANLPRKIAERQRNRVVNRIGPKYPLNDLRVVNLPSKFKGTALVLLAEFEHTQVCFFGLGALGKPAERVADEAITGLVEFMETEAAVDPFLADQLLLPLTFTPGKSVFSTSKITQHLVTNAEVIQKFIPIEINIEGKIGKPGVVEVFSEG